MTSRRLSSSPSTAASSTARASAATASGGVSLLISEEESTLQGFEKLFASVLDPQTQGNHQRHLALAKNVIFQNENGWKLAEMPIVSDFLQLLREKVLDGHAQFTDSLIGAVTLCCKPFVRQKSNEEISNPALIHGILPTLGQLLAFDVLDVQVAAADALLQFATGECLVRSSKPRSNNSEPSVSTEDFRLSPRVFSQNLLEETGTVEAIVSVLYDLFPDDEEMGEAEAARVSESNFNTDRSATPGSAVDSQQETERSEPVETERPISPTTPSTSSTPINSARESSTPFMSLTDDTSRTDGNGASTEAGAPGITPMPTARSLDSERRAAAILFPVIEVIYELSNHQRCAEVLVMSGALHYVVFIMENIRDPQDELLPLCIVILWNVLELCQERVRAITKCASRRELLVRFRLRNATYFLSNEFTFQTLLHVFELLLARGYRKQDKEMRNECLMILTLLARRRRSLDFFYSTGLTTCLLSYATAAEIQATKKIKKNATTKKELTSSSSTKKTSSSAAMPSSARTVAINADYHNYATASDGDFEFKQMLWYLLAEIMCGHEANLNELMQFRFVEVLLSYATGGGATGKSNNGSHHQQQYTPTQLQFLQTTALSVLNYVAPFILDHFYELDGHIMLLEFLRQSPMQSDENLAAVWLLMMQISPAIPFFQDELGKVGGVETAIAAFAAPPSRHTFGIRRNAILTCASMCRGNDSNRRRFNLAHGVHIVMQHLEFDPSHSVLEENILIGVIDAVRSCIVGDIESEMTLIENDGVPKLLVILEKAPKAIKNQVLAAFAEICVNPAAIPSFLAWRSDQKETNNATATQILLRSYADEEAAEELRTKAESEADAIIALANARHSAFKSITTCRSPFLVSSTQNIVESDEKHCRSSPSAERPQSPAFARLKEALKAAQMGVRLTDKKGDGGNNNNNRSSLLDLKDAESHPEINLKAKIYAVLANVSFASDTHTLSTDNDVERLSPKDQVMLEVAKEYPTFQLGEMWQNVHLALHAEGIRPIYADALYIRRHIEHAYNISVCTKHAQKEIFSRTSQQLTADESAFFEQILLQKHQEAQAEAFHRANLRQNSTLKLHFDAKRTRLEFMKKQDPTAFAAYESSDELCRILEPAPESDYSDLNSLEQKEAELRGRLGTLSKRK